jgi:hypothetical protein
MQIGIDARKTLKVPEYLWFEHRISGAGAAKKYSCQGVGGIQPLVVKAVDRISLRNPNQGRKNPIWRTAA